MLVLAFCRKLTFYAFEGLLKHIHSPLVAFFLTDITQEIHIATHSKLLLLSSQLLLDIMVGISTILALGLTFAAVYGIPLELASADGQHLSHFLKRGVCNMQDPRFEPAL